MMRKLFFLLLLGLWGCQAEMAPATAVPSPPPTIIPNTPQPTAVETAVPPTPTALPPATATHPPATPRPAITLAVPPHMAESVNQAISQHQPDSSWNWQIIINDDPKRLLDTQAAHIALVPGDDAPIVFSNPIVFAVPFITNWNETTLVHAQEILANGHNLVTVLAWDELTPDMKALRIDGRFPTDPDYPLQTNWTLTAVPGYETAVSDLAPHLSRWLREGSVQITAVGDLMLDRALGDAIEQGNLDYPFVHVTDLLQTADLTLGNLETALGDVGEPEDKQFPFQSPPAAAQSLAQAGFDIVSLANNHAMDYGPGALLQALELLHAENIATIGAGTNADEAHRAHFVDVNGLRLAFLGYVNVSVEANTGFDTQSWTATENSPGLAWAEPDVIREDVTAVAPQADLTIVMLHSGWEYVEEPSEAQVAAAHAAIDAGANLVIGHHAHILQGIHFYNSGVIVYGLANFAFQITGPPETAVLNVWLDKNGVRQLELIPAIIQESGQPRPAEPEEIDAILEKIYFLTMLLNAR